MKIENKYLLDKIFSNSSTVDYSHFINHCLYDDKYGYYKNKDIEKDFLTSPITHDFFGKIISKQLKDIWEYYERPRQFIIVELGGNSGKLKEDILSQCKRDDEDEKLGVEIMFRSLSGPIKQIAKNAGLEGEVVAEKCRTGQFGWGYNAATDSYEDLVANGVLDPAKVTINALENAASIAALVLTTEVLITEIPKVEPLIPADPNYV